MIIKGNKKESDPRVAKTEGAQIVKMDVSDPRRG